MISRAVYQVRRPKQLLRLHGKVLLLPEKKSVLGTSGIESGKVLEFDGMSTRDSGLPATVKNTGGTAMKRLVNK